MIVIRLPRPLSVNGLYYNHRSGGRAASRAHRICRMEAMQEISAQRVTWAEKAILGPYHLTITVERWRTRKAKAADGSPIATFVRSGAQGDLGNLEKCVSDVLVKMQVVRDDADAEQILLRWGNVAGCEVVIEKARAEHGTINPSSR